ncbi:AraC family transcriptional regulator [Jeotgalibacillus sp. ET6]|uniref:helix-turn-helix domain-containing protein n=1 Tax=Jeotgalibacillus sp. ET6 TaxID=3037260 RepID=UPI00241818C7|nr:AraC family transcriptional regulator [Jeotgalibacillus sp. ET6]MDG5473677.1 AraC family transcriptional regulator [Jeotgalibacillus sp. ET6]
MAFFERHGIEEKEAFFFFTRDNPSFPLHFHRAYEVIIVNEGELCLTIDHKEYRLHPADTALIFPNQMHEFTTIQESNITIVIFSPELIGDFWAEYKEFVPENNVFSLHTKPDWQKLSSIYNQKSFLYSLCGSLIEETAFITADHSSKTKVLYRILLFIDKNFMNDCSLKTVSTELNYDYAYLSKLFLHMTKMTFSQYLSHYRISHACYLLKNSQQSINEIAENCGYTNLKTFHRNFYNINRNSPTAYRKTGDRTAAVL